MTTEPMTPLFETPATVELPRQPSLVVVSISGGKDSIAALLKAREVFGPDRLVAQHQIILEDWNATPAYCQAVCDALGIPLYTAQGQYHSFLCLQCGQRHLSLFIEEAYCHRCGSSQKEYLGMVEGIHDLIRFRRKWVDANARFCTGHFKTEVWNRWARQHSSLLGENPLLVLGERHRESRRRARLPALRYRDLRKGWVLEWRPILDYRRRDAFRALRQYGIEPHECYKLQWRGMLRRQHQRWREGKEPHSSYPGQWEGLAHLDALSDHLLDEMIETLMYEVDAEGGPRCSCRDCFFKTPEELQATYQTEQGKALLDEGIALEQEINFTMKQGQSLESIVTNQRL